MLVQKAQLLLMKNRFPEHALVRLRQAGWSEGRSWPYSCLRAYIDRFDCTLPPAALSLLTEFGGLELGSQGRTVTFGDFEDRLTASHTLFPQLIGESLFPVGLTNLFEDDGLGVVVDASGKIYVDGATGYDPPRDYRLDLISPNIETFLDVLFSGDPVRECQSWYYSATELK
jgi:hypothetical protein